MSGNSAKVSEKSGKCPKSEKGQGIRGNLIVAVEQHAGNQTVA